MDTTPEGAHPPDSAPVVQAEFHFPKTQKTVDLMSDAPTAVTNQQLVDLHIKVLESEG